MQGKLITGTEGRHTHVEWLRFLRQIDRDTPDGVDIHLILDNCSTYEHQKVKQWLENHPRFHLHFTPTSSSWLNLVERFFGELTQEIIHHGSFPGIKKLIADSEGYIIERNLSPKPYVWRATGEKILRKIESARQALAAQRGDV